MEATWPVKEKDLIRLERNDARMIRWISKIGLRKIFTEKSRTRFKLKSMKESLQNRRMTWFGNLEIMKTVFGLVNLEPFEVSGSFPKGRARKI